MAKNKYSSTTVYYCGIVTLFLLLIASALFGCYESTKRPLRFFVSIIRSRNLNYEQELHRYDVVEKTSEGYVQQRFTNVESKLKILSKSSLQRQRKSKIILMWNTWHYSMTDGALRNSQCPVTSCVFTRDESLINQSDVVVLYIQTLRDFPVNRQPHQRFVFAQLESPITHDLPKILNDYRIRYGYFNWTMTYRWDSDIVHRGEYGYIGKAKSGNFTGIKARFLNDWSEETTKTFDPTYQMKANTVNLQVNSLIKQKSKLVAWFVSHCSTPIRREEYVQQLSKYINVDIFGSCTNRHCPTSCDVLLRTDYKFYLAFENSWCQDYVTEKFYRPLMHDAVPIVMGGANYDRFAPPHSYINARNFSSPKELAEYLVMLNHTNHLYAQYFEWKKDYIIIQEDNYGLCELCRMAHDESLPFKTYPDIREWWLEKGGCENDSEKYF